jgi:eukaryotic-like serine/threonine-protein kinase
VRDVLSCAAVIGRSFELPLLQAVTGLDTGALMASLEAAWSTDILVAAPDSRTAFAFDHELLRDALYESLAPAKRRFVHRSVAQALEQRAQAGESVEAFTLAHHLHAALPETDLRACVHHCIAAARAAGRSHAYADGVRYLGQAREALDLLHYGSPRLRLRLMCGQALYARADSSADYAQLIHDVMRLARAQKDAVTLAHAVLLLDPHPGFPPVAGALAGLNDALEALPSSESGLRAALLARRATSAPDAFDHARSDAQITQAIALLGDSDARLPRYALLSAQLYLRGGPAHAAEAATRLRELEAFCDSYPHMYTVPPVFIELHRAIIAQQAGDLLTQDTALVRCAKLARAVGSHELLWHAKRFQALARINAGEFERGALALQDLHRRAAQNARLGTRLLCVYDETVVLRSSAAILSDSARDVLALDPSDSPSIWSIKVRALAAGGLHREAHIALSMLPATRLANLPCDRDYLGTLGALARAAIEIGALDYAAALYELLEPHSELFAAHIAFSCEGSVAQLCGMLSLRLGHNARALAQLGAGVVLCERAGVHTCAEQARREITAFRRA